MIFFRKIVHDVQGAFEIHEFFRASSHKPCVTLIQSYTSTNSFRLSGSVCAFLVLPWMTMVVAAMGGCDASTAGGWKPKTAAVSPTVQMVDAIEVELTKNAYEATSFMGTLKPRRSIPLAFTQGGRVARIEVVSGQPVTADQTLARIDSSELDARKSSVQAAIQSAQQRAAAGQNSAQQRTQIGELQRELDEINQAIANATIKAPFAGVITKGTVEQGQVVSAGMPVFDLVESDRLIVEVKVATQIANGMNRGESVWVLVQGQPFAAEIAAVLPTTQGSTRTRTVKLNFRDDRPSQILNPGDAVEIRYWTQTGKAGFWLPYALLQQQSNGLWSALVVQGTANEAYARARTLDVIQLHDDLALVQGALNRGDRVIINGLNRIVPGQKVRVTLVENSMVIPSPEAVGATASDSDGATQPSESSP
jgi:RND family efflux transporter MFP subunit